LRKTVIGKDVQDATGRLEYHYDLQLPTRLGLPPTPQGEPNQAEPVINY